jgi:hypothetical protein
MISKGPMEAVIQRTCNAKGKRKGQTIIKSFALYSCRMTIENLD